MKSASLVRSLLVKEFEPRHVDAILRHFPAVIEKSAIRDWDGVALKAGKFIEATTKALMRHCARTLPSNPRKFHAGPELRQLENADSNLYSDTVRIVVPRACIFAYELVNNRGGRHDAHGVDANEMDAKVVVAIVSWAIAELARLCSVGGDATEAAAIIDELTNKTYPCFEEIDGRAYVNIKGLKPGEVALLLLYSLYPRRIGRQDLVDLVRRHGASQSAAMTALYRLRTLVDDHEGNLKLRGVGRQQADALLREKLH